MKWNPIRPLSFLLRMGMRVLGPYRCWRLLHECREMDPHQFDEFTECFLKSELPDRPMSREFLRYWLDHASVIDAIREHTVLLDSPFYAFLIFQEIRHQCVMRGRRPAKVLEIGPGMHLGALFCFAALGCEKVTGVDIAPIGKFDDEFYRLLKDYLGVVSGFSWWRYPAAVNPHAAIMHPGFWDEVDHRQFLSKIEYKSPYPSHQLPVPDRSHDLVYSVTAFEHFTEPDKTVAEIARVLEPGGLTIHELDLRHHLDMRYHKPREALKFLTWDNGTHASVSEKYGEGRGLGNLIRGEWGKEVYCNRLRLSDYVDLFQNNGFELLNIERLEMLSEKEIDRESFVEPFRSKSMDDLSVLVARITARKPT